MRDSELELARVRTTELEAELEWACEANRVTTEENTKLLEEVSKLQDKLRGEKSKYSSLWRMNCEQLTEYDDTLATKEEELKRLCARLVALERGDEPRTVPVHGSSIADGGSTVMEHGSMHGDTVPVSTPPVTPHDALTASSTSHSGDTSSVATPTSLDKDRPGTGTGTIGTHPVRAGADGKDVGKSEAEHRPLREEESPTLGLPHRGKAPPVESFSGESPDMFEDWLPTLQRAAEWNRWSQRETLIQLAGHLRGRALQEWGLLFALEKSSLEEAIAAMRNRLDPSSRAMATQDFRHATQHKGESVSDFIRRVEQLFKLAYGKDGMSEETRGTLLHGQLQEGLIYDIMKAPAVSGCRGYKELCLAARNEEKRLIELAK